MSVKEAPKGCIQRIVRIVRTEAVNTKITAGEPDSNLFHA
jgi:hypothetical protein